MKRTIIVTGDGSKTIQIPEWNEQYHSKHGAINESEHVFIKNGFDVVATEEKSILEIGFGTGLNCFTTFLRAVEKKHIINYTGVDGFPISEEEFEALNYTEILKVSEHKKYFDKMFHQKWNSSLTMNDFFTLNKVKMNFENLVLSQKFDLIYFDAFGPRVQPELWTEIIFEKMISFLKVGGKIVTYCAKGSVRRNLISVGFKVERLKGPPGKREMLRGTKIA